VEEHKGKVVEVKRDRNFNNQLFARVDTKPDSMFFRVRSLGDTKIGDDIVIYREEGQMMYYKITINGKRY
jgi:hypothetical protein